MSLLIADTFSSNVLQLAVPISDNKIDDERDYIRLEIRKKDIDRMIIYYKILLKHD